MLAEQLSFDLPRRAALGREDFFVSQANEHAMTVLDEWQNWAVPRLALVGPKGSGKSHLARVWAADSGADIIDFDGLIALEDQGFRRNRPILVEDLDRLETLETTKADATERAMFHLYNAHAEAGLVLVVTGCEPPARWRIILPDLASRLGAMPLVRVDAPDSALLQVLLIKLFADRQINVAPGVIGFLALRIERDGNAAERVVDALDRAAMRERRGVTRPFAASVLKQLGQGGGKS